MWQWVNNWTVNSEKWIKLISWINSFSFSKKFKFFRISIKIKITFLEDASQSIKNNQIDYVFVSSQYVINNDFLSKQIFENNELSDKPLVYFNDSIDDARELAAFVKQVPSKVNIIEYNPIDEGEFQRASDEQLNRFTSFLEQKGVIVNVRRSRGRDIDAACGQLANKNASAGNVQKKVSAWN